MGEVYRATDTRLDRPVAVKVLATQVSSTPEFKQRMEREARAISSLSHPHICQLYDIGSQNGTDYMVMEFLDGETLADRLRRGSMPFHEVLKTGIAIAEALAAAHRHGIVHRDLKPGNIMLTPGGAKLMDFGLAKPVGMHTSVAASGNAPSFTAVATLSGPSPLSPLTTAGTVVGTIQYMSPEQIEGKEADARSDIFAFGAVLYEMVTGKRPFTGKSQLSIASAILEKDPDPIAAGTVPAAFEHVVNTCLQKNPDDRYLAAHDVRLQLRWIASAPQAPALSPTAESRPGKRTAWNLIGVAIAALILGLTGGIFLHRPTQPAQSAWTVIDAPAKVMLNLTGDFAGPPVLSPDGATLAFTGTRPDGKTAIWIRPMNSLEAHELAGTEGAIFPFWSPDGHAMGFFADAKLKTIDVAGGSAATICDAQFARGGSWGSDGTIVFTPATQTGIMRVSATGGTPSAVTKLDHAQHSSHRWPFFLPDGKHFLYLAINHDPARAENDAVYYASVDGRENRLLFRTQANATYSKGYILFARGSQLMARHFDPNSGTLSGEPETLAGSVVNDISTWHMDASAADNGLLVLGSGGSADWQLVWMDRSGKQVGVVAEKLANLQTARISPQGDRVAFQIDTGINDVWVLDLARGIRTRLTFGPVQNTYPIWSPDGKWIAYNSSRNGDSQIYRKRADGSGAEELLLNDNSHAVIPTDWSRDGKYLIYMRGALGNDSEIWALPLQGDHTPEAVVPRPPNSSAFTAYGQLSPDGRWIAYTSTESGTAQVYVAAFRGGQGKWQVSTDEGSQPKWSHDGKTLYYANDITRVLSAVPVREVDGALQFGAAQPLVTTPATQQFIYDVSPDEKKILLNVISQQVNQSITVMSSFTTGLKN